MCLYYTENSIKVYIIPSSWLWNRLWLIGIDAVKLKLMVLIISITIIGDRVCLSVPGKVLYSDPSSISSKFSSEYEYFFKKFRVSTSIFSSILEYLVEYWGGRSKNYWYIYTVWTFIQTMQHQMVSSRITFTFRKMSAWRVLQLSRALCGLRM